jgi:hypothetical protein
VDAQIRTSRRSSGCSGACAVTHEGRRAAPAVCGPLFRRAGDEDTYDARLLAKKNRGLPVRGHEPRDYNAVSAPDVSTRAVSRTRELFLDGVKASRSRDTLPKVLCNGTRRRPAEGADPAPRSTANTGTDRE